MDDTTDIETNTAETSSIDTEKCDISPEYLEKGSSDTNYKSVDETTPSRKTNMDEKDSQISEGTLVQNKSSGFAFTIDFSEGKSVDARKLKEMAQHFQNRQLHQQEKRRHRRGVSLSKLEDCRKLSTSMNNTRESNLTTVDDSGVTSAMNKPPFKHRNTISKIDHTKNDGSVGLRTPKSTATIENKQDSVKRHSWSPRSSLCNKTSPPISNNQVSSEKTLKYIENIASFQPKSTILQRTLDCNALTSKNNSSNKSYKSLVTESTVDHIVTTPLEYLRSSDDEGSLGDASQATYTLDGDNYTEEEKERMSIDKFNRSDFNLSIDSLSTRDRDEKHSTKINLCDNKKGSKQYQRDSNEKEQSTTQKSAKFYLDKLKTRVKSLGDRKCQNSNKNESSSGNELDHGTFTR